MKVKTLDVLCECHPEKINHLSGHLRPCGGTIGLRTSKMSSPPTQSA